MTETINSFKCTKIRACRTCLDSENEDVVMLNGEDWSDFLDYCVGLKIQASDEPQTICRECADIICHFVEFKKKCLASDSLWKSITPENMESLMQNYTTDIETFMKQQLLNYYEIIDTPNKRYSEANSQDITIKQEHIEDIYVEHIDLVDHDSADDEVLPIEDDYPNNDDQPDTTEVKKQFKQNDTKKVRGKYSYKCKKCKKVYARRAKLKAHVKYCGKTNNVRKYTCYDPAKLQGYSCGLCKFTSESEEIVHQHFDEHRSRNDLKCELCEFEGIDFADMVGHRLAHNTEEFRVRCLCPICKEVHITKMSMQFHYRSVHMNKKGGYCPKCDMEFSVYKTFKLHVRGHYDKKFICDHCGLRFLVRNRIIEHLERHNETKKFICHECGKGFKRHSHLLLHLKNVHVKETPLKCTHCNKMFKNRYTLNKHRFTMLEKKNSLKCEVCGKCFATPLLLRSHLFWHTGEKPHCCEICGSRYKAKGQLKIHMRNHTGVKPFQCSQCPKSFIRGLQLKRHSSVHTGVKPYKCSHCDRSFYNKKEVLKHCAVRHKDLEIIKDDEKLK